MSNQISPVNSSLGSPSNLSVQSLGDDFPMTRKRERDPMDPRDTKDGPTSPMIVAKDGRCIATCVTGATKDYRCINKTDGSHFCSKHARSHQDYLCSRCDIITVAKKSQICWRCNNLE